MGESRTRRKGKEGGYCPFLGFGRDRESFVTTEGFMSRQARPRHGVFGSRPRRLGSQ